MDENLNSRKIMITEDGSHTVAIPSKNITYHSVHGAVQESNHVFIQTGLHYFLQQNFPLQQNILNVFEMGFGTGLNALLSLQYAIEHQQTIHYQTIEPLPLSAEEAQELNYTTLSLKDLEQDFNAMHTGKWDKPIVLNPYFSFQKIKISLEVFETPHQYHIIYFDAFDPNTQPELWVEAIFIKMYNMLYANGLLITYCSKGTVQRAMKAAGFTIEKLKGPPGKREIIRAKKIINT